MQVLSIPTKKRIHAIAFSPSGRDLAAACGDHVLRIWDTTTGDIRQVATFQETSAGYNLMYLDDTHLLFAGTELVSWDLPANAWNAIRSPYRTNLRLALSPDRRFLAEADRTTSTDWAGSGLMVRDTSNWSGVPALGDETNTTSGVAFNADATLLATGHILLAGQKQRYHSYVPGGFAVNDYEYFVRIREVSSGRVVHEIPGWQQGVSHLIFSPDGEFLVGTAGPRLRIWDLKRGRQVALHKRGTKHFQGLAFVAGGRYLYSVSNDTTVRVWDTTTWAEHTTITWEIGKLLNLAIAPDGLRAAAGSDRGKVVIWDVEG